MKNQKLLVVCAHPDDEILGCGGLVALRVRQGWEARLLVMTQGVAGRSESTKDVQHLEAQKKLKTELKNACEKIGFSKVTQLEFPDNRMDTISRMDVALAIRKELLDFRPHTLLTHHYGDYNWDHTVTFDAVMMAARSSPGDPSPDEIWSFEVLSSTERSAQTAEKAFRPNIFINIKDTLEQKMAALGCYASEVRDYPHPRSLRGIEILARKRGLEVGLELAEAFELIRRKEI